MKLLATEGSGCQMLTRIQKAAGQVQGKKAPSRQRYYVWFKQLLTCKLETPALFFQLSHKLPFLTLLETNVSYPDLSLAQISQGTESTRALQGTSNQSQESY